ncbi:transcriptional regulator, TetR family [Bacteriovorax sp. DB6_IX]|nr:transcriptional regulator, TetR family [Bacteriovorax sp. DB6_IX]
MGLREKKKQQTREMILNNSMELFTRKGVDEVGMRELAQVCGLGIGTYYNYFKSKEEVIFSLFADILREALRRRPFDVTMDASPGDTLADNYQALLGILSEHKNILDEFLVVVQSPKNYVTEESLGSKILPQMILDYWEWVRPMLESIHANYENEDTGHVARLMWGHFLSELNVLTSPLNRETANDFNRFSSRHFLNGFHV